MHVQFCGAAGEVTGSCTKLAIEESTLLIDCGLFQGQRFAEEQNYEPFPFHADSVDAVLVTHAHLDHCGRLPKLVNQGFAGKIYATDATRDLVALMLIDAAHIMRDEAEEHNHPPLYTEEDVLETMDRFMTLPYDKAVTVAPGVTATLHNAGHVLGSSFIEIKGGGKSILFSGDIGNYPVPLLPQAEDLPPVDAMVLESTYGDKLHGQYDEGVNLVKETIRETVRESGVMLIPAFSLERTQELLTVIDKALSTHSIPVINAYLDSPLGIRVSRVYKKYDHYFNEEMQALEKSESDHSVLQFPSLICTETSEQSKLINDAPEPKLIIAGSGMMQGGRILHHLKRYLPSVKTRVVIVGHQVRASLGYQLLDGAQHVTIHGERIEVKAKITATRAFSSHMDQHQMLDWLRTMPTPPKAIFLNHGDDESRVVFSKRIEETIKTKVFTPSFGQGFTLASMEQ